MIAAEGGPNAKSAKLASARTEIAFFQEDSLTPMTTPGWLAGLAGWLAGLTGCFSLLMARDIPKGTL